MKKVSIHLLNMLKEHICSVLFVLLIVVVSFLQGMEVQKAITNHALEDEIVEDFLMVQHEIAYVLRNTERDVPPCEADVVILRNCSSEMVASLRTDSIRHKTRRYPNSVLYLIEFNNVLQGNSELSSCVQQYGPLLCEIQVEHESDLDGFLYSIENRLSQSEVQGKPE